MSRNDDSLYCAEEFSASLSCQIIYRFLLNRFLSPIFYRRAQQESSKIESTNSLTNLPEKIYRPLLEMFAASASIKYVRTKGEGG